MSLLVGGVCARIPLRRIEAVDLRLSAKIADRLAIALLAQAHVSVVAPRTDQASAVVQEVANGDPRCFRNRTTRVGWPIHGCERDICAGAFTPGPQEDGRYLSRSRPDQGLSL